MPFNVAVVGYGLSAKVFHIPFITAVPDLRLYAVVQRTPSPDNDPAKDHPGIKVYRATDELLADDEVTLVVVTTTPESHFALTEAALKAGKNVVVEKPFVPTPQEADKLVELANNQARVLSVFQNRRWDADYVTASNLVKSNTLGRIVEFESHFDRFRPVVTAANSWKAKTIPGGGAIYDLGTHLLDQIYHLFGKPERITGFVGKQRLPEHNPHGFEDWFTVLLHYKNNILATAKGSVVSPEESQLRFWVRGDKGSFKKYHLDCQEGQLKEGLRPGNPSYGKEPSSHFGTLTTVNDNKIVVQTAPTVEPPTYVEYYKQVADSLAGKGPVPVPAEEAQDVIKLIALAKESSKSGQTLKVD